MDKHTFVINGITFRCSKFDVYDGLKISKRLMGYMATAYTKGITKKTVEEMMKSGEEVEPDKTAILEKIGDLILDISDEDIAMIFDKSLMITEVQRDNTFTAVAMPAMGKPSFCHDDIKALFSDISNVICFLYEVLKYNFFSSLKDIGSKFKKPA